MLPLLFDFCKHFACDVAKNDASALDLLVGGGGIVEAYRIGSAVLIGAECRAGNDRELVLKTARYEFGHIDAVGYDLYVKILNEAILEEKGVVRETAFESQIDLSINANIPERYVSSAEIRILLVVSPFFGRFAEDTQGFVFL